MKNNNLSQSSDSSISTSEDKGKENDIQLILNDTLDNNFLLKKIENSKYPLVRVNKFNVDEYNSRYSSFRVTKLVQTIIDNIFYATYNATFVNKKIDIQYLGSRKGYGVIAIDNIYENEIVSLCYGTIWEKRPRFKSNRIIDIVDGDREYWLVPKKDDEGYAAFYNDNHLNPNLEIRYLRSNYCEYKYPFFITSRKILKDEELTYRYFGSNEDYWWRNVGSKYQSLKYDLRKPKALCSSKSLQKIFEYHVDKGISEDKSSFEVVDCNEKGKGVIAKRKFPKDSFLMFYNGQEVDEKELVDDAYVYEIHINNKRKWVNAFHSKCYSRFMNDNNENPNVYVKPMNHPLNGKLYIVFLAKRDIEPGDQLEYDYGGGSRNYDWRKKPKLNEDVSMNATPEITLSEGHDCMPSGEKQTELKDIDSAKEREMEESQSLVSEEDFINKVNVTDSNTNDLEEIEKNITKKKVNAKDKNVANIEVEKDKKEKNVNNVEVMEYDDALVDCDGSVNDDIAVNKLDMPDISSDLPKMSNSENLHQVVYNFKETLLGLYKLNKSNELNNEYSSNTSREAINISASQESSTYLSLWKDGRTLYEHYLKVQMAFKESTSTSYNNNNSINWLPVNNNTSFVINDYAYSCLDHIEALIMGKGDGEVTIFSYEQKMEKLFEFICKLIKLPVNSAQEPLVLVEDHSKLGEELCIPIEEPNDSLQNKNTDKESANLIENTINNEEELNSSVQSAVSQLEPTSSVQQPETNHKELTKSVQLLVINQEEFPKSVQLPAINHEEPTKSVKLPPTKSVEPVKLPANNWKEPTKLVQQSATNHGEPTMSQESLIIVHKSTNLVQEPINTNSKPNLVQEPINKVNESALSIVDLTYNVPGSKSSENNVKIIGRFPKELPLRVHDETRPLQLLSNTNFKSNANSNITNNSSSYHNNTNNSSTKNIQQFNIVFDAIESWLLEMERDLEVKSCGTDLNEVQIQLNKLAHFDADILSYRDRMDGFKLSCQHLKESTLKELNIQTKQKILEERYSALLEKTLKRKSTLKSSLKAFRLLREIEEEEAWIKEKEPSTQITSWGRELTGVQTLISKHEEVVNEIKRHESKLIALRSSALQNHFTSNKSIHSKLAQLNKSWDLLLWNCKKRMDQLYHSQKIHQFFVSASRLEKWLDEREKAPSMARSSEDAKEIFCTLLKYINSQAEEICLASKEKDLEAVSVCQGFVLAPLSKENIENHEDVVEMMTNQKDTTVVKSKLNAIKDRYNKLMKRKGN